MADTMCPTHQVAVAAPLMLQHAAATPKRTIQLLDLPAELFEEIATWVDRRGLRNLRLALRDCFAKSLRIFARLHYTTPNFALGQRSSIRDAVGLLTVTQFVHVCERLVFQVPQGRGNGPLRMISYANRLKDFFADLLPYGRVQTVCIRDNKLNSSLLRSEEVHNAWPFLVIMEAIQSSDRAINTFQVHTRTWCLPIHSVDLNSPVLHDFLHSLTRLEISIWVEETQASKAADFIAILTESPNLRILDLTDRWWSASTSDMIHSIADAVMSAFFPGMEKLTLATVNTTWVKLLAFIKRQPKLQRLDLLNVALTCKDRVKQGEVGVNVEESVRENLLRLTGIAAVSTNSFTERLGLAVDTDFDSDSDDDA